MRIQYLLNKNLQLLIEEVRSFVMDQSLKSTEINAAIIIFISYARSTDYVLL